MKLNSLVFLFLFCASVLHAQVNLVPNFSFEQHDTCPIMEDQVQYAIGWSKYSSNSTPTNTTPDYYNSCSPDSLFGVPKSFFCYQPAARNCDAYIGLVTIELISWSNYREFTGIQLTQPLTIGQQYFISFKTVMGESSYQGTQYGLPTNNIGIKLSTVPYNGNNPAPIDNFAHLRSVAVISDSVNWQLISGSIVADSAYQYLIIGNFYSDTNTDTIAYGCGTCYNAYGYYLVDDICLSTDSMLCNIGIDTLTCSTSVNEFNSEQQVSVFPNPASDLIEISLHGFSGAETTLYDIYGNELYFGTINNNFGVLDISFLASGTYFLIIQTNSNAETTVKKIIKL